MVLVVFAIGKVLLITLVAEVSPDLHEIYPRELSFILQATSFTPMPLRQVHLSENDLLGLWLSAWLIFYPHNNDYDDGS